MCELCVTSLRGANATKQSLLLLRAMVGRTLSLQTVQPHRRSSSLPRLRGEGGAKRRVG
jgi:hypothetical protein